MFHVSVVLTPDVPVAPFGWRAGRRKPALVRIPLLVLVWCFLTCGLMFQAERKHCGDVAMIVLPKALESA
ncbi:hypothetical protein CALCODRAFT_492029 [Calocera cornea HHB12733]|uniref:Uncharacterized protein n=1 Tax=Calocera cornea HHB12733 TaxID=1353952 RepID=A0A165IMF7_9BASI|nr:hypothetical protein CALCODRAFT_492029 [Calocera cornea HHB12733]